MKRLYVGNLSFNSTENEIRNLFENYGEVRSVQLISDRETGRPRGFGFVEIEDDGAERAVEELNLKELDGRRLNVNEARPRDSDRRSRRW